MDVLFDNLEKSTIRKQKLEKHYSDELGYKIKILSDAPYMEEMLEMYCGELDKYSFKIPLIGEKVKGKIVGENSKFILVDINYKDNIYIEKKGRELDVLKSLELEEDQDIELLITNIDEDTYEIRGSVASILVQNARKTIELGLLEETAFDGFIKEFNPAGYFVQLQIGQTKIDSFMPKTLAGINKLPEPESIVGQTLKVMIENKTKEGFIVSRKKYLKTLIKEQIELLEHNTVYTGFVTGTTDFGIFVELEEGIEGLVHVSEISEEKVENPTDFAKVGEKVSAVIINIIKRERKIGLSIKALNDVSEKAELQRFLADQQPATSNFGELLKEELDQKKGYES